MTERRLIIYHNTSGGMFGMLKSVLCALSDCEADRVAPTVVVEGSPYRDEGVQGNIWSHFFDPIGDESAEHQSTRRIAYHPCINPRDYSLATRLRMSRVLARWVAPALPIRERIMTWAPLIRGAKRRIGVHYRGADGSTVYPFVPPGDYAHALRLLRGDTLEPWFLATDSTGAAAQLDAPKRILTNSERVPEIQSGLGIHLSATNRRKAGSDAILDAWLLAECHMLLCGPSNLSDVCFFLNPQLVRVSL